MKMGKAFAVSAVTGILMGSLVGCGGADPAAAAPKAPTTDNAAPGAKASCSANGAAPAASGEGQKSSCSASGSAAPKAN